jgi:hypothetical protein
VGKAASDSPVPPGTAAEPHPADALLSSTCRQGRCKGAAAISGEEYGFSVIQQQGDVPFELRQTRQLVQLMEDALSRACEATGQGTHTDGRGSVSLAITVKGQPMQLLWYPLRMDEIDSVLFMLDRGSTEQLLVRTVEAWRRQHGHDTGST